MPELEVIYDVRGAQTPFHPERGIPRYVVHQFRALAEARELAGLRALADPSRPVPLAISRAAGTGRILAAGTLDGTYPNGHRTIHHIGSPFEFDWTQRELLPHQLARPGVYRVVNLYDAVPLMFRRTFLRWTHAPWYERLCRYRAELLGVADLVLCISEFAAEEGIRRFGLDERRIRVVGAAVPEHPPRDRDPGRTRSELPGLNPPFVLYTGGAEHPRKNLFRLIRAFARLPGDLRNQHQLVIASRLEGAVGGLLAEEALRAGIEDRVLLTGYVSDSLLDELYARCACLVYPSLYEGFGFPVVEGMRRGAPIITSNTTACREAIGDSRATFDPRDEADIAGLLGRVLSDDHFARSLREHGKRRADGFSWKTVAERTVDAYRELVADRPARSRNGRPPLQAAI
jgi:glycosyltransferase involved in cell wall biosynthesis